MPLFRFICEKCGASKDELTLSVREAVKTPTCCGGVMDRDYSGKGGQKTVMGQYDKPVLSEALGVTPRQIPDMMKRFPGREYTPDGRLVMRNHYERNRILREEGMHDNN